MAQTMAVKAQKARQRRHRQSQERAETVFYPVQKKIAEALVRCERCGVHGPKGLYARHLAVDHGQEVQ